MEDCPEDAITWDKARGRRRLAGNFEPRTQERFTSGGTVCAERLWPVRYGRQCDGVVRGLVRFLVMAQEPV